MESPGVQMQFDPVAPAELPKSRDVAPGRKRDDQSEGKEAAAASAALTASFAEILQSRRQDLKAGAEEREKNDPALKGKKIGHKTAGERVDLAKGQAVAVEKRANQPATGAKIKGAQEDAAVSADAAAKTIQGKPLIKENNDSVQTAESSTKAGLSAAEEAQLREMIQKNGAMPGRKDTTSQMKGIAAGETLNHREAIASVKSMTAKEGEVLKNLSGSDETEAPQKIKTGRPGKAPHASARRDLAEGESKSSQPFSSADTMKQEFADLVESSRDKLSAANQAKKQGLAGAVNPEARDPAAGAGPVSFTAQGKGIENATPVRPQAVVSQVLDGAVDVLRNGSGRVALTLQPPQLGKLDLDVAVKDNHVTMIMLADNQEVKQMLQSGMDDLRNALQDKGFQIDRMEVLVQNRPDDAGAGFWQEAGFSGDDSPAGEQRKREPETAPAVQRMAQRASRSGENGISIFA